MKKYIAAALLAFGLGCYFISLGVTAVPTTKLFSAQIICSGDPWYDVRCSGAVGDGATDDKAAIQLALNVAIQNQYNVHFPHKRFKVNSVIQLVLNPGSLNFNISSDGAIIDGSSITSGSVLLMFCGDNVAYSKGVCENNFRVLGMLQINGASAANTVLQWGYADFSDSWGSVDIDAIFVSSTGNGGACFLGQVVTSNIKLRCQTSGTNAALTLGQASMNTFLRPYLSSSGGDSLRLATSTNYGNTFISPTLIAGGSAFGLSISSNSSLNTFLSPNFATAGRNVSATLGVGNTLISPVYSGTIGASTTGITLINDTTTGNFANVPASATLPQIAVGGSGANLGVSGVTFTPRAAPGSPASGQAIEYVDSADNKLKAKFSTGAVRNLGVP